MPDLAENYHRLIERIAAAAIRSGRRPEEVRLIGVTKRVDPGPVLEAIGLGLTDIGESRVQEAEGKLPLLEGTGVRCHLIGHLQSNKARRALQLFASIQTVDTAHLARRLDGMLEGPYPVFIQTQSGGEATKSGIPEPELGSLVDLVRAARWLDLRGFMAIPPFFEDAERTRPYFRRLSELGRRYGVDELSMGMSHDFEVAIEEGATQVRIGTALFGERR